jgi:hypothetical protein
MADDPADLEIRLLRPGDDPDAQLDLSERAFGPGSSADDAGPANTGRWQLSVAGGAGTLDPLGPAGTSGPALDAAFAATPYMLDAF